MAKQTKKKNPPARTPEELAPEDPGGPVPPGEPPDAGAKASEASATLNAQSASLAPATVGRPTDAFTTNDVKPGPSTMEGNNTGTGNATMAYLKVPNAAGSGSTRSRIDETVEPRPEEELGRITRSKAQQTAGTPTMGRSRSDTGGAQASMSTPTLTAADFNTTMAKIMGDLSKTITTHLSQTIDATRDISVKLGQSIDASQASTRLIRDEMRTLSSTLKADARSSRDELSKGLQDLGQHIAHEITVALTTTSQQADNLNQASLQTILDILQNRSNVQVGANPNTLSSPTTSTMDQRPEPEIPSGSRVDKGKGRVVEPLEEPSQDARHTQHAATFIDNSEPYPPEPQKWSNTSTPNRRGTPPNQFSSGHLQYPPGGSSGRRGRGGGGGGGGGGDGGGPGGPPHHEEPSDDDMNREPEAEDSRTDQKGSQNTGRSTGTPSARSPNMTRANTPREPSPGYDWRQLTPTHRVPGRATTRTTDTTARVDRYDDFRLRIRRGVTTVVRRVIDREPLSSAPNTFIKSVAATTPIPKYGGNDNLEEFMKWLQEFLTFVDIHQLVGHNNDYNRTLTIGAALEDRALRWYNLNMRGPLSGQRISFLDVILAISDEFLTPASATKAQQNMERVTYTTTLGIRAYVREVQNLSRHVFMPIDDK